MSGKPQRSIIEIRENGDPFGGGYTGMQSDDGGASWVYRGDIGAAPVSFWRQFCREQNIILKGAPRRGKQ